MSVVSHVREHYRWYKLAMGKAARRTTSKSTTSASRNTTASEERSEENPEGSSWMADHAKSHHGE